MTAAKGDWTGLRRQLPAIGVLFFLLGTVSLLHVSCRIASGLISPPATTGTVAPHPGYVSPGTPSGTPTSKLSPMPTVASAGPSNTYSSFPPGQHMVYFNWRDRTLRLLSEDQGDRDPILAHRMGDISPDGTKVAYVDNSSLVSVDLVTGETRRIPLELECYNPASLAPNENRLAVECEDSIYIYTLVDASFAELTDWGEQFVDVFLSPKWAPNGEGVAYSYRQLTSLQPLAVDGIYVTEVNCLDASTKCSEDTQGPFLPYSTDVIKAWAPDSHSLAVFDETKAIRVIDLDSNEMRLVADNLDFIDGLAWSPDGEWIAFSANGDIFSIPSEGGEATLLATDRGYLVAWIEKGMDG